MWNELFFALDTVNFTIKTKQKIKNNNKNKILKMITMRTNQLIIRAKIYCVNFYGGER